MVEHLLDPDSKQRSRLGVMVQQESIVLEVLFGLGRNFLALPRQGGSAPGPQKQTWDAIQTDPAYKKYRRFFVSKTVVEHAFRRLRKDYDPPKIRDAEG